MTTVKKLRLHGFKSFSKLTEIEFGDGFNCVIGANGSGKSIKGDSEVLLPDGSLKKIKDLVDNAINNSRIKGKLDDGLYVESDENNYILSINPITLKQEYKKITKYMRHNGDKNLFEITTRTGKKITTTGCHSIIIFKDGYLRSIRADSLKEKDLIALPRIIKITHNKEDIKLNFNINSKRNFPQILTPDFARFLGYIIGDGYLQQRLELINSDLELIEDFKNLSKEIFNINEFYISKENITYRLIDSSPDIRLFLQNLFNSKNLTGEYKSIPDIFLSANDSIIKNLLSGLFDTDGYVSKNGNSIEFSNKNKKLVEQIHYLLLRFGIISIIKEKYKYASNTEKKIKRKYYFLSITGTPNLEKFYNHVDLRVKHKKERLTKYIKKDIKQNTNIDFLPREINLYVKELAKTLGIKVKNLKKEFPSLGSYIENRCYPTRYKLNELLNLFKNRWFELNQLYQSLEKNQIRLAKNLEKINVSARQTSPLLGLSVNTININWKNGFFNARSSNLNKLYHFEKKILLEKLNRSTRLLNLLDKIVSSEIFWDQIVKIEKVDGEDYVYDIEVEDNHNFIANGIFVHNSNVSDAVSFVLGRLSAKSLRAERSSNLIFNGGKHGSPAKQAEVSIIFDNSKNELPVKEKEVKVTRIVKQNGQSVYKLNDNTVTRQQILETLGTAKIDPDGHNIVLQGDIVKFTEMPPDDRREIIEEVSGISIYEDKKHKALLELDKVESRLKEADIILTERGAHLRELKKDKDQALKYRELHKLIKENKATYINIQIQQKQKSINEVVSNIEKESKKSDKIKQDIGKLKNEIELKRNELKKINEEILSKGEKEQIDLNKEVDVIKTDLVKNTSRLELLQNEILKLKNRKEQLKINFDNLNKQINDIENQKKELEKNKANLEKEKSKSKETHQDNEGRLVDYINQKIVELQLPGVYGTVESLSKINSEYEVAMRVTAGNKFDAIVVENDYVAEECINFLRKNRVGTAIFLPLNKIQTREIPTGLKPLLKSEGVHGLALDLIKFDPKFKNAFSHIFGNTVITDDMEVSRRLGIGRLRMVTLEGDLIETSGAIIGGFRKKFNLNLNDLIRLESDLKTSVNQKKLYLQERERNLAILKEQDKELSDFENEIKMLKEQVKKIQSNLGEKEKQEKKFYEEFKDLGFRRDKVTNLLQDHEITLVKLEGGLRSFENVVNNINLERAKLVAEKEGLEKEFEDFKNETLKKTNDMQTLLDGIQKAEQQLILLGNVNLRALEIYEQIEKEFNELIEKKEKLRLEKQDVLNMMNEIESKKKDLFMQTLNEIDKNFRRIFSNLSKKGEAYLELEDPENIFTGGLDVRVKITGNKYLDIRSLSGGEKTLTAMAFIFAIQEYQPASFYLFDEVDAALDKTNSEKLSSLIYEYSKNAQYIIISHNDSVITEAQRIYGVSMQDGVSKVIGLKL